MSIYVGQSRFRSLAFRCALASLAMVLVLAGCGDSGDDGGDSAAPNVGLAVTSGSFTTTVRSDDVTEVPFSETVVVEATFEEPIYGAAGQTSVFAEVSPTAYRVGSRPRRNERTFIFSLTNRTPGTAEVSIYESRDAEPITFTLQIGEE
ncbi:MAG: hypothetical protein R3A46_17270 [Thermomicrobiales bacterium]